MKQIDAIHSKPSAVGFVLSVLQRKPRLSELTLSPPEFLLHNSSVWGAEYILVSRRTLNVGDYTTQALLLRLLHMTWSSVFRGKDLSSDSTVVKTIRWPIAVDDEKVFCNFVASTSMSSYMSYSAALYFGAMQCCLACAVLLYGRHYEAHQSSTGLTQSSKSISSRNEPETSVAREVVQLASTRYRIRKNIRRPSDNEMKGTRIRQQVFVAALEALGLGAI
jgi:hypothetical protein